MFLVLPLHPFACKRRSPMKVFVAGATGAIGKRLVPQLVASGYEVVAMTRSPKNIEPLRAAGGCRCARPFRGHAGALAGQAGGRDPPTDGPHRCEELQEV